MVLLPGLEVKATSDVLVAKNRVHGNNHENFAPPGNLSSFVPSGSGILVVGADRARVSTAPSGATSSMGIAVASTLVLGRLAGLPPDAFADIEPNPDGVAIRQNRVSGNGGASPIPFLPGDRTLGHATLLGTPHDRAAGLKLA